MSIHRISYLRCLGIVALWLVPASTFSPWKISRGSYPSSSSFSGAKWVSSTALNSMYTPGRASSRSGKDRSKRQFRVGQLVQTELGRILHSGLIKGDVDYIEDDLRRRISIVSVDVSPDLRQARVTVSVRKSVADGTAEENSNPVVDQRRAYSWLVENTRAIRHTLAQKMSHMKNSPSLTFVQVDVGAAVDVMYLIDKVSSGYERERIGEVGEDDSSLANRGFFDGFDDDDDDEWEEEDEDFFEDSK